MAPPDLCTIDCPSPIISFTIPLSRSSPAFPFHVRHVIDSPSVQRLKSKNTDVVSMMPTSVTTLRKRGLPLVPSSVCTFSVGHDKQRQSVLCGRAMPAPFEWPFSKPMSVQKRPGRPGTSAKRLQLLLRPTPGILVPSSNQQFIQYIKSPNLTPFFKLC